jgi:hypothetical protein
MLRAVHKFGWTLCLVLALYGFSFFAFKIFRQYKFAPDIVMRVNRKPSRDIPMPAFTFCEPIYPEQIQLEQHIIAHLTNIKLKTEQRVLTQNEQNYLAVIMHTCGLHQLVPYAQQICTDRSEKNIVKLLHAAHRKTYSYNCEFRDSSLGGCQRVLTQSLTSYGICQTINLLGYQELFNPAELSEDFDIFKRKEIAKFPDQKSELFNVIIAIDQNQTNWTLENGYNTTHDNVLPIRATKLNKLGVEFCFTIENVQQ